MNAEIAVENSPCERIEFGLVDPLSEQKNWVRVFVCVWKNLITTHVTIDNSECEKMATTSASTDTESIAPQLKLSSAHPRTERKRESERGISKTNLVWNKRWWHWIKMPKGIGQQIDFFFIRFLSLSFPLHILCSSLITRIRANAFERNNMK